MIIGLFLASALSLTVALNNLSPLTATLKGSGLIRRGGRKLIVLTGFLSGLLIEGNKLLRVNELVVYLKGPEWVDYAFIVTLILFTVLTMFELPAALSQILTAYLIGLNFSFSLPVYYGYIKLIVLSWVSTPLIAIFLSIILTAAAKKYSKGIDVWRRASAFKLLLVLAVLCTSYAFGSNTLGLLAAIVARSGGNFFGASLIIWISSTLGILLVGDRFVRRVGWGIYQFGYLTGFSSQMSGAIVVELLTQIGVPVSMTHSVISGMMGSALASRIRILKWSNFGLILVQWFISPIIGFLAGYFTPLFLGVLNSLF